MAFSIQYAGTSDVIRYLGGTSSRLSVGTSGTDAIHVAVLGTFIMDASDQVDLHLSALYGTRGFGTNAAGTTNIPAIVRQVTARLAASLVVEALEMTVQPNRSEWSKELRERAMEMLQPIEEGVYSLPGVSGVVPTEAALPKSSVTKKRVKGELVTLTGTTLVALTYQKCLAHSEVVYGTVLDAGTVYTRDTDYTMYYYSQGTIGNHYGELRRKSGGAIAEGQNVFVDYDVLVDTNFDRPSDHDVIGAPAGRRAYPLASSKGRYDDSVFVRR